MGGINRREVIRCLLSDQPLPEADPEELANVLKDLIVEFQDAEGGSKFGQVAIGRLLALRCHSLEGYAEAVELTPDGHSAEVVYVCHYLEKCRDLEQLATGLELLTESLLHFLNVVAEGDKSNAGYRQKLKEADNHAYVAVSYLSFDDPMELIGCLADYGLNDWEDFPRTYDRAIDRAICASKSFQNLFDLWMLAPAGSKRERLAADKLRHVGLDNADESTDDSDL